MNIVFTYSKGEWVFNSYIPDNILEYEKSYLDSHDVKYKVFKSAKFDLDEIDNLKDQLNT
jgi:hypothetical protein